MVCPDFFETDVMYYDLWPDVWLVFKSGFNQEQVIVARLRYVDFLANSLGS